MQNDKKSQEIHEDKRRRLVSTKDFYEWKKLGVNDVPDGAPFTSAGL